MDIKELENQIQYQLERKGKIHIINLETGHDMWVRSIFEIPHGYIFKGRRFSKKEREHQSKKAKERGTPKCAYRNKSGSNNPMYGKKYIFIKKGTLVKRVPPELLNDFLNNGWEKGRII